MKLSEDYATREIVAPTYGNSLLSLYSKTPSTLTDRKQGSLEAISITSKDISIDISIRIREIELKGYSPKKESDYLERYLLKDDKTPTEDIFEELKKRVEAMNYPTKEEIEGKLAYWHVKPSRRFGKTRRANLGPGFYGWTNTSTGETEINENLYGIEFERVLGHEDRHDFIHDEKKNREATDTVSYPSLY